MQEQANIFYYSHKTGCKMSLGLAAKLVLGVAIFLLVGITTQAQTTTALGAEKNGNADGSIPAWTGGITTPPPSYKIGDHHPDPFGDDAPLFEITEANVSEYSKQLSKGHIELLKLYPSFKMPIYPSRRSASFPEHIYNASIENAKTAKLAKNGNGVENASIGIPFPKPQNGLQAIWNHMLRYRGDSFQRSIAQAPVTTNGNYNLVKATEEMVIPYSYKKDPQNILGYIKQHFSAPARLAGVHFLAHETINQAKGLRQTWLYLPGQRRVRRAPFLEYDAPANSSDGLRTFDQFDMYNGATNRYNWELLGKREMYVPYNSYKLHSDKLKYKDIIGKKHLNTGLLRYELHRVWVVEAKLKDGSSHVYPRRIFYIDEDSWQILVEDIFDANNRLWRVSEGHPINYYEVPLLATTVETHYDIFSRRYLVMNLNNETSMYKFNVKMDTYEFTPQSLRQAGLR